MPLLYLRILDLAKAKSQSRGGETLAKTQNKPISRLLDKVTNICYSHKSI